MPRVYPGLYDRYDDATRAVADLRAAGVPPEDISLIASNPDDPRYEPVRSEPTPAGTGARIGSVLGGGAGLLTGLGLMAIPGVGPVVAAGWLVATLAGAAAGAATGGVLGALTQSGISDDDAQVYAEGLRRGGAVVSARVADQDASRLQGVMDRSSVRLADRATAYRKSGWTSFDPKASPYTADQVRKERQLYGSAR